MTATLLTTRPQQLNQIPYKSQVRLQTSQYFLLSTNELNSLTASSLSLLSMWFLKVQCNFYITGNWWYSNSYAFSQQALKPKVSMQLTVARNAKSVSQRNTLLEGLWLGGRIIRTLDKAHRTDSKWCKVSTVLDFSWYRWWTSCSSFESPLYLIYAL
jgi:hypothetical protein